MTHVAPRLAEITRCAALCAAVASAVTVVAATAVALTGVADETRAILGLSFAGVDRSPAQAAAIALHNARIATAILLCACLAPRLLTRVRGLVDVVLVALLALNATTVGLAFGAYGMRAIRATALHLPLELAALSLAGGAYMQACKRPLTLRATIAIAAASALLLIAAAALETYTPPGAS